MNKYNYLIIIYLYYQKKGTILFEKRSLWKQLQMLIYKKNDLK